MPAVLLLSEPQPRLRCERISPPRSDHLLYAFPPFLLVHKVLLKIQRDKVMVIMVALAWRHQHWYITLLELSVGTPIALPLLPDLIT